MPQPGFMQRTRALHPTGTTGGRALPKPGIAKEPPEWRGFGAALEALLSWSTDRGLELAVVGGIAVSTYSRPRATKDIDVQLITQTEPASLLDSLSDFGFGPAFKESAELAVVSGVLPLIHTATATVVDIIFARFPFMEQMVRRAVHLKIGTLDVPVVQIEDLCALKLFAARPQDLVDVQSLLKANLRLNRGAVLEVVREYAFMIDEPELYENARQLLEESKD